MPVASEVLEQIVGFARARGVRRLILFGSRARGDVLPKSDIDLAVEGCADFLGFEEDVTDRATSRSSTSARKSTSLCSTPRLPAL